MQGEMPGFPFPGRPGGEHDEPLLDMIISRRALPPDAPQEMHDLARMLAALAGPAEPGELAGEAAARAAFVRLASPAGISPAARRPVRHRRSRRSRRQARSRAWLAAAVVSAAAGIAVLAAYAGLLPNSVQQLAHVTVAAPAPHHAGPLPSPVAGAPLAAAGSPTPPAPRPHDSAAASAPASPAGTPALRFTPDPSPTPALGTASPGCGPGQGPGQGQGRQQPEAKASGYPGSPYWWQATACASPPTHPGQLAGEPTLPPYLPRS
jgi:hypothetical protein